MKLSKKHIGKMFDVEGADGSWAYTLVGVRGNELLFNVVGRPWRFEISTNGYEDWRPFRPVLPNKLAIRRAWNTARRSE